MIITYTNSAAAGTRTNFVSSGTYCWNTGEAYATPANSAAVLPRSARTNSSSTTVVTLTPKFSRIRSARPFPVTAPIRAHISCVTISASVTGISSQSIEYPNCAPAIEYVWIPPTSLSALAVMIPGPTIEKNSSSERRIPRRAAVRRAANSAAGGCTPSGGCITPRSFGGRFRAA